MTDDQTQRELAYWIGLAVGQGGDSETCAATAGVDPDELREIRVRFHRWYDTGLTDGRRTEAA